MNWERTKVNINGKYLNHLRFDDDIILIPESSNESEIILNDLKEEMIKIHSKNYHSNKREVLEEFKEYTT